MNRVLLVVMLLIGCKKHGDGPWKITRVDPNGQLSIERDTTSTYVLLTGVSWPPPQTPLADDAAAEVQRLAKTGEIAVVWPDAEQWAGPGVVRVNGVDLAQSLIASGFARAAPNAPPSFTDAEAKAKAAHAGGWGERGKQEMMKWLRGRALETEVIGVEADALDGARQTAWQFAATSEASRLAFFEITPDTDPGPPPCVDRLAIALRAKLKASTAADLTRAFTDGGTIVGVPTLGAARCETWTVKPGGVLERIENGKTSTRTFKLDPDAIAIAWLGFSEKTAMSNQGGSGPGRARMTAAGDDAFVIGGSPWFSTAAACQREIAAAFPSGCSAP